jgi:hypothetical protein
VRRAIAAVLLAACVADPSGAIPSRSPAATAAAIDVEPVTLSVARAAHTATKLADGRVLVAGGFGLSERTQRSMEMFVPATSSFTDAGELDVPRYSHTATLLADGRVLIAGGYTDGGQRLASAVLYDPARATITPTGSMLAPRADQTAVRLADGRVLLAGGTGDGTTFLASAEIYDPVTARFVATSGMHDAREANTMTLLRDGRVLIAGGHRGRNPDTIVLTSSELYDPRTGSFAVAAAMGVRRAKHDAVRLPDGDVLVMGGADERDDRGAYASAERYDVSRNAWTSAPPLSSSRYKIRDMTALLEDGRVLVAGGASRAELYSPTAGAVGIASSFGRAPMIGTATLLDDGRVLLAGGYSLSGPASRDAWLLSVR